MIWYLVDFVRSIKEREAIETLAAESGYLTPLDWRVDSKLRLILDADIAAGGQTYEVSLRYPNHFPHSPPLVLPRNSNERWSYHQWGAGGELCLEYGPDNWHPDITGAMMLESAYRLLDGEGSTNGHTREVASRHAATIGQTLRGSSYRFLETKFVGDLIALMPEGGVQEVKQGGFLHMDSYVIMVTAAMFSQAERHQDPAFSDQLIFEAFERDAVVVRWPNTAQFPSEGSFSVFRSACAEHGITVPSVQVCVLGTTDQIRAYSLDENEGTAKSIAVVTRQNESARLDSDHLVLGSRKVGIVGCGSVGSKIAVMLARSGVTNFLLIDDDIMLPGNLVRHDLDWRGVGAHKVDAVARRIQLVTAAVCERRRHRLGGQESSGAAESVIGALAKCDLIIDATADAHAFNYLCAACKAGTKPLVWAEVFGGGVGGLVARYRPTMEPEPATMRRIIENWCNDKGKPIARATGGYDRQQDGQVLIADDADVTVIAAHAARMAVDTLIGRTPSIFPQAVYMIGLGKGWIFSEPFDTQPIDVGGPLSTVTEQQLDDDARSAEVDRVIALFAKYENENSSAADDH